MDADRFDTLTRTLTVARSRRRTLAALLGGVLAAGPGRAADAKGRGQGGGDRGRVTAQTHDNGGEHGSTRTTICHKRGTPAEQTLEVDNNALPDHQAHGDTIGPCGSSGASCLPPPGRDVFEGGECVCLSTATGELACLASGLCSGFDPEVDFNCLDVGCPDDFFVCAANPCCGPGFGCIPRCTSLDYPNPGTPCTCTATPATCALSEFQVCGLVGS